jgi:hypothetical protein
VQLGELMRGPAGGTCVVEGTLCLVLRENGDAAGHLPVWMCGGVQNFCFAMFRRDGLVRPPIKLAPIDSQCDECQCDRAAMPNSCTWVQDGGRYWRSHWDRHYARAVAQPHTPPIHHRRRA